MEEASVFDFRLLGTNITLCLMGLFGYSLIKVRPYVNKNFNFSIFFKDNVPFWIWAGILEIMFVVLMTWFPELETWAANKLIVVMVAISGVELNPPEGFVPTLVYLGSTYLLAMLANKGAKKEGKIGIKRKHQN